MSGMQLFLLLNYRSGINFQWRPFIAQNTFCDSIFTSLLILTLGHQLFEGKKTFSILINSSSQAHGIGNSISFVYVDNTVC